MVITIRDATPADCRPLAALHVGVWRDAYAGLIPDSYLAALDVDARADRWRTVLAGGAAVVKLHFDGDDIVGFASYGPWRDGPDTDSQTGDDGAGEVTAIYYRKDHWGSGHARDMMTHVLTDLAARGYRECRVWVLDGNRRAIAFYEKHGFVADGARKEDDRGEVVLHEIRMTCPLPRIPTG